LLSFCGVGPKLLIEETKELNVYEDEFDLLEKTIDEFEYEFQLYKKRLANAEYSVQLSEKTIAEYECSIAGHWIDGGGGGGLRRQRGTIQVGTLR
jgi:hypothetical protein